MDKLIKGRGAQINTPNRFDLTSVEDSAHLWHDEDEREAIKRSEYLPTHPKEIINKVESPDVPFGYSANPYQGCEHGCIYCYARNTHTYWGYSAGLDFETKILVKDNAPQLLEKKLKSKAWKANPIMLSGNTDCYQPIEKERQLTKKMLEILWRYRHPVSIITKSALILRDKELLSQMAEHNLVKVAISITTLDKELRDKLEPRTATGAKRIQIIKELSEVGVPVHVMMAPIIPSLNDHEIDQVARHSANAGARSLGYTFVRLNGDIAAIFKDWLQKAYPDRYDRVVHQIEGAHGGTLHDSRYGTRMRGEGHVAEMIRQQVHLARRIYFAGRQIPVFNLDLYEQYKDPQMKLF